MSSPKVAHETWTWRFPKCTAFPRNSFSFCRQHIALPKCHIDSNNDALKHVPDLKKIAILGIFQLKFRVVTLKVWWLPLSQLWPAGAEDTAPFWFFSLWAKATWNTEHSQVIRVASPPRWNKTLIRPGTTVINNWPWGVPMMIVWCMAKQTKRVN